MIRYEKRKTNTSKIKCSKKIKQFYRYFGEKTIEIEDHPHMAETELYWKTLWGKRTTQLKGKMDKKRRKQKKLRM
jgi:hypothetical protein